MADGSARERETAGGAWTASASCDPAMILQCWLSPAFPIGSFAYSHGLEWAAHVGLVGDRASLEAWLGDIVAFGAVRSDNVLLAEAWRASHLADSGRLREVAELAAALQPSSERRLEAITQGNAFLAQIEAAWPCATVGELRAVWPGDTTLPVAVGVAAAGHGLQLGPTLRAFGLACVSSLASAAIRLSIVGQTDAQRIIASLAGAVAGAADRATRSSLDDLGTAVWSSDLCSLRHETQYTRLFRS